MYNINTLERYSSLMKGNIRTIIEYEDIKRRHKRRQCEIEKNIQIGKYSYYLKWTSKAIKVYNNCVDAKTL